MMTQKTLLSVLALVMLACGPRIDQTALGYGADTTDSGGVAHSTDGFDADLGSWPDVMSRDGDGDGDPFDEGTWATVQCRQADANRVNCYGVAGSSDAWNLVISNCRIEAMKFAGELHEFGEPTWSSESCAAGETPETFFPTVRCGWLESYGRSVCFVGDGNWFTVVSPSCELPEQETGPWPSWICDGQDGPDDPYPWDAITCGPDEQTMCLSRYGSSGSATYPTCWLDAVPESPEPDC